MKGGGREKTGKEKREKRERERDEEEAARETTALFESICFQVAVLCLSDGLTLQVNGERGMEKDREREREKEGQSEKRQTLSSSVV